MPQLRLHLLGGFHASREGGAQVVDRWRRPGAKTIVKLLAVADGHRLHRGRIIEECWPAAEPAAALRNLRVALHAARHGLQPDLPPGAPSPYLVAQGDLLLLDPDRVHVDVDEVTALAQTGLMAGEVDALEAAHRALQAELLPEDRYADWAAAHRDRLAELRDRVAHALADGCLRAGRPGDAIDPLLGVLDRTPGDEAAHRGLILAYLALGRRRQAMGQYHRCVQALRDELGTRPGSDLDALYREALAAPRSRPASLHHHLPAPLRRLPATPLYGRDRALALLTGADVRLVIVAGEAGVGKTRLVTEAARKVADAGGLVLWGAAHDAAGPTPYGPVAEALDGYLAGVDLAERADVAAEYPELAALLPSLGSAPAASAPAERAHLFQAVGGLLDDLAGRQVLVVLDDVHASDRGTLQLLFHLSRSRSARSWQIVATLREEDLDPLDERRRVLDAVVRQGLARRVELMRLDRADCVRLVAAVLDQQAVPEAVHDRVWALSLGNPMFAMELAGSVADVGLQPGLEQAPLTDGIRRLVADRIDRLDPAIRAVLDALVAAGGDAPLVEVEDVAANGLHPPLTRAAIAAALDAAVAARLVEERDVVVGGRSASGYAFRHPLVRMASYERIGTARRRALHAAFGAAVGRHRPDAVDALAYHLTRADDPAAGAFLHRAATRAAALYANDTADAYYTALLVRLDAVGDPDAPHVRLDHAVVLRRLARYADAERVLTEALTALQEAGDADAAVSAAAMLAEVLGRAGRPADGVAVLDAVDPSAPGVGVVNAAGHHLAVGVLAFSTGRYAEGLAAAARAEPLARAAGAAGTAALARALANRAACLVMLGDHTAARRVAEEALPHAERADDTALLGRVLSALGELARSGGRLFDARAYAERALAEAERNGDPTAIAFERGNLGRVELLVGDVAAAERLAASAVELARPFGGSWCLAYTMVNRAEVHLGAGQLDAAAACLEECEALATRIGDPQVLAGLRALRAELALSAGRPADALAALDGDVPAFVAPLRVRALAAAGQIADALSLAEQLVGRSAAAGERLTEAEARYALGLAHGAAGDAATARRQLTSAMDLGRGMPYPALVARAEAALQSLATIG